MKQKTKFSNRQLRSLIRPMFASTILFGYATPEQVEKFLDGTFGKESRSDIYRASAAGVMPIGKQ